MPTRTPTALVALPATVAIAAALALALSGCAGGSPAPSDAASDSPNPTPTFGPSTSSPASSSPVAPRDQSAFGTESPIYAPGCETFLTEEQTVALVDQGYVPDPTSTWPDVMAEAAAAGGTWCAWTAPDGSPDIRGGVVAIPEALWQAKRGDLIAQGATEDDASRPGFIALPDEGAPDVDGGFVYADGYLVYVSDPKLAASVTVLQ